MALSAMKSLRRRSHTYEVEIVAQYAGERRSGRGTVCLQE